MSPRLPLSQIRRALLKAGAALALPAAMPARAATAGLPQQQVRVAAPFDMPAIVIPDFAQAKRFAITDFGADQANQARTSGAIARAIDAASKAGGGVVVAPPGTWPTAAIHFKSNVNLHVEEGATLMFSELCMIKGDPGQVVKDVTLNDVQVNTVRKKAVQLENVQGFVDHSGKAA